MDFQSKDFFELTDEEQKDLSGGCHCNLSFICNWSPVNLQYVIKSIPTYTVYTTVTQSYSYSSSPYYYSTSGYAPQHGSGCNPAPPPPPSCGGDCLPYGS